ncbi:MAG: DUF4251 domain-containing protein [Salinivirgaceae bacterium]|jgi:hypothetical protein|nr:DUF4251 domain-containing protein [Salinivirgaceae bacterium]
MKQLTTILLLALFFAINLNAQIDHSRKDKRIEKRALLFAKTDSLISTNAYKFNAAKANPASGQQIDLTTHNADLTIHKDSAISYLPFFGRAYIAGYGGTEGGIKFEEKLIDYKLEKDSTKLNLIVSFSVKSSTDTYNFILSISYSGFATLSVTSNHRAFISYFGNIVAIKE